MLQVFLYIQVFLLGVVAALAARYAYYAFFKHPRHPSAEERQPSVHSYIDLELPAEVKQRLLHDSQVKFEAAVKDSAAHLQHDLEASSADISSLIKRLAADVVEGELKSFHEQLKELQQQTESEMGGIRTEITKHQQELEAKMAQDVELEKQRLVKQIDTRLGDAVASFLLETLQHNVDLGNQNSYLVSMLEEHKPDFIKEVGKNEAQPTK